jgi:FlaA1/EpsC-like NDP-sugar epimerase
LFLSGNEDFDLKVDLSKFRRRKVQPVLVTGGAGFIGSNFILHWLKHESSSISIS